jgi:biopolymer transport protein ExbD
MAIRFDDVDDEALVAEINITPLTDIFLVLLIIFMISSSAMIEGGLQVKLPTAKSAGLNKTDNGKPIYITIAKDGKILVNEKQAPEDNLTATLKQELEKTTEKTVVIRGDESIFLGKAVKIMDSARSAGAEKIAIATQPPNK